jgi:stage III sporulation protein AE
MRGVAWGILGLGIAAMASPAMASPAAPFQPVAEAGQLAESLDFGGIDEFMQRLERDMNQHVPSLTLREVLGLFEPGRGYDFGALAWGVARGFADEFLGSLTVLGSLLVLVVLCGVLRNLQSAFAGDEVARIAYFACYLVLAHMAAAGFLMAVDLAQTVVRDLVGFMQAILPVMITLLLGMGALTTAGLLHPLLLAGTQIVGVVVADVVLPIILFSAACDLASSALPDQRLRGLAVLLRQAAVVVLGILFTGFLGIVTVQGAAGAVADGVALRTTKFMAGAFIPVVGGMFADAVELVFGSTQILKMAVGVLGMMALVAFTVFPLAKLAALAISYRLASVLAGPFDVQSVADTLAGVANGLTLIGVAAAVVGLVFLVSLAALLGAGNAAVMLR